MVCVKMKIKLNNKEKNIYKITGLFEVTRSSLGSKLGIRPRKTTPEPLYV